MWIKIHGEIVRFVERRDARLSRIHLDAAEVCDPQKCLFVVPSQIAHSFASGARLYGHGLNEWRQMLATCVLLIEAFFHRAIRLAVEHERAVF